MKINYFYLLIVGILIVFCCYSVISAETNQSEQKFISKDKKVYKMDFSFSKLDDYKGDVEWEFSKTVNGIINNGVLSCKENSDFSIRSGYITGDDYGLEPTEVKFDMKKTGGVVALGVRLKRNMSKQNEEGLWFTINNDSITVTEPVSSLNETVSININQVDMNSYHLVDKQSEVQLLVDVNDQKILLLSVEYSNDILSVKDGNGNQVGKTVKNICLPQVGYFRMDIRALEGAIDNMEYTHTFIEKKLPERADTRTIDYSAWFASDDLNRVSPSSIDVGTPKSNKYVGLFYFIAIVDKTGGNVVDNTAVYLERGIKGLKSFLPTSAGGYWAEPYFGYYLSTDEWVYRKHAAMLSAAGVDFIYLDMSNRLVYEEAHKVLFDTWAQIRKEGGLTPQIVCMTGDDPATLVIDLYTIWDSIYSKPEYKDLFFLWEGKPLILGNNDDPKGDRWTISKTSYGDYPKEKFYSSIAANKKVKDFYESGKFKEVLSNFTVRKCWAWQSKEYEKDSLYAGYWDFLDDWPQAPGRDFKGNIEQISVSMGTHAHTSRGRSYLGKAAYDKGQDFGYTLNTTKEGLSFKQQFERAMEVNPSVLMITGWNEWYSSVQKSGNQSLITGNTKTPGYYVIDEFTPEYSRDGEPMKIRDGVGFGDNYYYQMVNYIREFKGLTKTQVASGQKSINLANKDDDWKSVGPEYRDTIGDTAYRNHLSWRGKYLYVNNTGRNDLDYAKVSQDNDFIYFYITTVDKLVLSDDSNWMNLYIDIDMNNNTGWEGYDYVLNRSRDGSKVSVERFVNNDWKFEKITDADYVLGENSIIIKVAKSSLGLSGDLASFDFKWADNSTTTGNVMQFMDMGDSAPDNRFNFRFYASESSVPIAKSKGNFFSNLFNSFKLTKIQLVSLVVLFLAIVFLGVVIAIKPKKRAK